MTDWKVYIKFILNWCDLSPEIEANIKQFKNLMQLLLNNENGEWVKHEEILNFKIFKMWSSYMDLKMYVI